MEFKFWPGATLDSIFSALRSPHFHIHKINKYWYFIFCLKYIFRVKKLKFMLEFSQNKVVHVVLSFVFSTVRNPQSAIRSPHFLPCRFSIYDEITSEFVYLFSVFSHNFKVSHNQYFTDSSQPVKILKVFYTIQGVSKKGKT